MALCDQLVEQQKERETRHAALARASLSRFAGAPTPSNLTFLSHKSYTIRIAELRKSIVTLAVQGKLVSEERGSEPEGRLREPALASSQRSAHDQFNERPSEEDEGLGFRIPKSWRWVRLGDLSVLGPTNGISPKPVEYETSVRSLTLSATTSGKFKGEHSKFIDIDVAEDSELWLRDGDILVQRGNTIEYVGVAAVYHGPPRRFVYPDLMMKLRVSPNMDVDFLALAMSQDDARNFLRARASGTSGSMPKINQATLRALPLPIPPLPEQRRIVAKAGQLMALVDQLDNQLGTCGAAGSKLLDAVISELTAP